ncbi:MAG: cob(I)yrinic acid a,c-diamide adenosyltransferase [Marinobacterium sp.]|nr:cob(I)yrinic acid a,c-diamide adenosyltransferase [Marinobacterium sp.]
MADRLTRIYTRRGDSGQTSLASGTRVDKYDLRVEAMGELDELNCQLGLLLSHLDNNDSLRPILASLQHRLFDMGGEIAMDNNNYQALTADDVNQLEQSLDALNDTLPPLKEFILPGGSQTAALCHQSRALCRRAERRLYQLAEQHSVNPQSLAWLNRLSDLLFVCARVLARRNNGQEVLWNNQR